MSHALRQLRIDARPEAVSVTLRTNSAATTYHLHDNPWDLSGAPKFSGHTVLVIPALHIFVDPTIDQFVETREAQNLPALFWHKLPTSRADLGNDPITAQLGGCDVTYRPHPANRDAWHHPKILQATSTSQFAGFGHNLASAAVRYLRDTKPSAVFNSPHQGLRAFSEDPSA